MLGDVFADEMFGYNLKASAGKLVVMVVEVFDGVPSMMLLTQKHQTTSSRCESHRCIFMFARAEWRFDMCLFHCCETMQYTLCEIERF